MDPSGDNQRERLGTFRTEVLLAAQPPGAVIAHAGTDLIGFPADTDGPAELSDVFAGPMLDRVIAEVAEVADGETMWLPDPIEIVGSPPRWVRVAIINAESSPLRAWVFRLHVLDARADDMTPRRTMADTAAAAGFASVSERFGAIADAVPFVILAGSRGDLVDYANPAAAAYLGRSAGQLRLQGWLDTVDESERALTAAALGRVVNTHATEMVEFRVSGAEPAMWLRGRMSPASEAPATSASSPSSGSGGWVVVLNDVTAERHKAAELARRATHDPLTGLSNRTLFLDRLEGAIARAERKRLAVGLLFLDVDNFKLVNDVHGHQIGDAVLAELGRRIDEVVRDEDTAARYGGDEFVVLTEGVDLAGARDVAQRVADAVNAPMELVHPHDVRLKVTVSVGVAWSPSGDTIDRHRLVDLADRAMYDAKRSGSGLVVVTSSGDDAGPVSRERTG